MVWTYLKATTHAALLNPRKPDQHLTRKEAASCFWSVSYDNGAGHYGWVWQRVITSSTPCSTLWGPSGERLCRQRGKVGEGAGGRRGGGGGTAAASFFVLFLQSFSLGNVGALREVKVILGFWGSNKFLHDFWLRKCLEFVRRWWWWSSLVVNQLPLPLLNFSVWWNEDTGVGCGGGGGGICVCVCTGGGGELVEGVTCTQYLYII